MIFLLTMSLWKILLIAWDFARARVVITLREIFGYELFVLRHAILSLMSIFYMLVAFI